jgi:hypothetical protein
MAGVPSNSVSEAGILRVLDGFENAESPWVSDPLAFTGDRASVSLVNARHPDVYENLYQPIGWQRMPGFVLADAPTLERLSCAYFRDAAINGEHHNCDHEDPECRPGCAGVEWCEAGKDWFCAFQPWRLKDMMDAHDREKKPGHQRYFGYNEESASRSLRPGDSLWGEPATPAPPPCERKCCRV